MSEWTLRENSLQQALRRITAAGFDAVELLATADVDIEVNRRLLADSGLIALSVCPIYGSAARFASPDRTERRAAADLLRRSVDYATAVGAGVVIVVPSDTPAPSDGPLIEALRRAADSIGEVAAGIADGGPTLVIEPLNRDETAVVTTVRDALELCAMIGSDSVAVMADTFHLGIEEPRPQQALRDAGPRLRHVHLADNHRREPGTGRFDFRALIGDLQAIGYRGSLVIEAVPTTDDGLAAGRRYLTALLDDHGCG